MTLFTPRRLSVTTLAIMTVCLTVATPTLAQQRVSNPGDGRSPGMRYLTWPGKGEHPRALAPVPAPVAEPREDAEGRGPILSMPSQPLVAPVATRYSARTSPGPTPASAWVSGTSTVPAYGTAPPSTYSSPYNARNAMMPEPPRGFAPALPLTAEAVRSEAPRYAAAPMEAPRYEPPRAAYVEDSAPPPAPPVYASSEAPASTPTFIPVEARRAPVAADTGPAAMSAAEPAPAEAAEADVVDPYAPRPDAPIFRMLNRNSQPAPAPVAPQPSDAPAAAGSTGTPPAQAASASAPAPYPAAASDADRSPRRYSVHRANGQSPDRVPLPDPVLLDSAPVDLAEPPEAPTVVRNINGRLTAINPASEDPSQP